MSDIESLILDINKHLTKIEKGTVTAQEAEDFFADSIRKAREIFKLNTDEWRMLDRWQNESRYMGFAVYKPGVYAEEGQKKKITNLLNKLKEVTNTGSNVDTSGNEYSFSADQKYEAYRLLISIFKGAQENIWIIDNFLDEVVFDFIDVVRVEVQLNLITDNQKPIFKRVYLALKEKKERSIDAKINSSSHDRYIVIDGKVLYSIGASINTIGKKDFMMHRINEKQEDVMVKINAWWSTGTKIV
jgi:hypothetical protein